jgi:DNA invertase Pin-like site-specific DNA recombinase
MAYLRTSSATNVGPDKDSDKRQREAIRTYAKHAGYELVGEFYDAAVSGADPIDTRPGFMEMMTQIAGNGVRTVIVEDASRFARTLMVQEAGIATLAGLGVRVLTSRGDDLTESDDEMRVAMRQIAGVFHSSRRPAWSKSSRPPASASAPNKASARAAKPTP